MMIEMRASGSLRRNIATCLRITLIAILLIPIFCELRSNQAVHAGGLSPQTTTLAYPEPPLLASAAAVFDVDAGRWLRLYNPDLPLPMASTTKIMTALLAIEHGHLRDLVRVSHAAATIGESSMGLVEGERLRMSDLLYGLILPSGNDAAIAIAEHVGGSQRHFVAMMNAKAAALHLTHTHFVNPYGFSDTPDGDDPAHYSSARDLVILTLSAMRLPLFRQVVGTSSYTVPATKLNREHDLSTVNFVLLWYPGADGVKPGWTSGAGFCQVVDVHRKGRHLLAAILHTNNIYTDVRDLMNYALHDFTWIGSGHSGDYVGQSIQGGTASNPTLYFPYTGHELSGTFLRYFSDHGGFSILGAPRTEVLSVDGYVEQFFSNQVLSLDPITRNIVAERLGFDALPSAHWLKRVHRVSDTTSQRYYAQTGHTITYRFLDYFLANGGINTFGYPITEKQYEHGTLVQYFENAELVWHPEGSGFVGAGPLGLRRLVQLDLVAGDNLPPALHAPYVLRTATATPRPTPRTTRTAHPTATSTATLAPPSPTRTLRPTSTPTSTRPRPTATPYRTPTVPSTPSMTRTRTATPVSTSTRMRTQTPTKVPTATTTAITPVADTPVPPSH